MSSTPDAFAPVHDELVQEARLTLQNAAQRLEAPTSAGADDMQEARQSAIELAVVAMELLHRAELAAVGVHEAGG